MKTSFYFIKQHNSQTRFSIYYRKIIIVIFIIASIISSYYQAADFFVNNQINKKAAIVIGFVVITMIFKFKKLWFPRDEKTEIIIDTDLIQHESIEIREKLQWSEVLKVQMNFGSIRFFYNSNEFIEIAQYIFSKEEIMDFRMVVKNICELKNIELQIPSIIKEKLLVEPLEV